MLPEPIKKFVDSFAKLPGIGPRQATRLAYYIAGLGKGEVSEISKSVSSLSELSGCRLCFLTTPNKDLCSICADPGRRQDLIAVVEKETDLLSLEKTRRFNGRYLLLGELKKTGALDGIQKARLKTIQNADEVILAISPTTYGDINSTLIAQELKDSAKRITRLGRGIPTGGEIEFADEETLSGALDNRH